MHVIPRSAWIAQPWRNGRGTTLEIARWPAAGAYDVRVSLAEVSDSGPFSTFVGYRRHTFLVGPAPIRLGDTELVAIGDHIELPGERALDATLLAGPTHLLNILVRTELATVVGRGPTAHPVRFTFDFATQVARTTQIPASIDTHGCAWIA